MRPRELPRYSCGTLTILVLLRRKTLLLHGLMTSRPNFVFVALPGSQTDKQEKGSRAVKMVSTAHVALLSLVLAGVSVSDAARETLRVTERGVEFTVVAFNDGRNRPHRLRFTQDGTQSSYTFNRAERVVTSRIGSERYRVSRCRMLSRKCRLSEPAVV